METKLKQEFLFNVFFSCGFKIYSVCTVIISGSIKLELTKKGKLDKFICWKLIIHLYFKIENNMDVEFVSW